MEAAAAAVVVVVAVASMTMASYLEGKLLGLSLVILRFSFPLNLFV
jgi:hypothetical protein